MADGCVCLRSCRSRSSDDHISIRRLGIFCSALFDSHTKCRISDISIAEACPQSECSLLIPPSAAHCKIEEKEMTAK